MSRFPGNIIKLPNVTPTQSSAQGVWSLKDQLVYQRNNQWPFQRDPYFNYTTLLLQGNVPNTTGPQAMTQPLAYNSDASTNNFLVTPNGDVSPRPFSPYGGGNYSVFFDGSSSFLSLADNAAFNFGTGDATVEFWFNSNGTSNNYPGIISSINYATSGAASIRFDNTGYKGKVFMYINGGGDPVIASASTIPYNTWAHVALVRQGTSLKLYLNGSLDNSVTISAALGWYLSNGGMRIGRGFDVDGAGGYFPGYISNLRLVKGTAVYTSNFTPPTQPLQNITNTSLLTCQSNRFIDNGTANSGSGFTITTSGSPRVTDNSPFVSTDFTTGAGYFDGNGDWLAAASNAAFGFGSSLNDFTVQGWFYVPSAVTGNARGIFHIATSINGVVTGYGVGITNTQVLQYYAAGTFNNSTTTVTPGQWYFLTMVRSAGTVSVYLNGSLVQNGSVGDSQNFATAELSIGVWFEKSSTFAFPGYISDFRVVKGSALAATIPTAPLQPITNTSLLTLQTRAASQNIGFIDSSPNEFIVTKNGNTTQGTFSPFSPTGWGNYFDGSGDYLATPTGQTPLTLNTDDFTFECWYYLPTQVQANTVLISSSNSSSLTNALIIQFNISTNAWQLYVNGTDLLASASGRSATLNTWQHIAITRSGSTFTFYLNGVAATGVSTSSASISVANWLIGYWYLAVHALTGYISNLRIVKGVVVYTGAFTPPTQPLAATQSAGPTGSNIAAITGPQTSLLTCQSNRFKDNSPNNFTITVNGTPSVQAFSPFAPATQSSPLVTGGSGYFDGDGDYLSVDSTAESALNLTGTFTLEFWFYRNATGDMWFFSKGGGVDSWNATNGIAYQAFIESGTLYFQFYTGSIVAVSVTAPPILQWNHFAVGRDGTTLRGWLNGSSIGTTTSTPTPPTTRNVMRVAANTVNGKVLNGYMAGLRIVNGSDVYGVSNTSITVPTTPLPLINNTSLLLNFTGGGIVDATGKNNLETVANAQVSTVQAKWDFQRGGGSLRFDGDADQIKFPASPLYALGTGDFTIELWAYSLETGSSQRGMVDFRSAATGTNGLMLRENSGGFLVWTNSGAVLTTTTGRTANQWQHVALVRASGTLSLYVNGLFQTSTPSYTTNLTDTQLCVSGFVDTAASPYAYYGYLSNVRITKFARYSGTNTSTPNFTLPTGPFPIG